MPEEKQIICLGVKFRQILNSSEKVFYGGDTKIQLYCLSMD